MHGSFKPSAKLKPLLSDPSKPFIHRDLSWLQFNSRVLNEAIHKSNPILERAKFLSISSSNLDEFFMIRISSLGRSIISHVKKSDHAQVKRLQRIRSTILSKVEKMTSRQGMVLKTLSSALKSMHTELIDQISPDHPAYEIAKRVFEEKILPHVEPPQPYTHDVVDQLNNTQLGIAFGNKFWTKIPNKLKPTITTEYEGKF